MTDGQVRQRERVADFVRRCVRRRACVGMADEHVRAGVMAEFERSFGRAFADPKISDLLPGYLALAREAVAAELARLRVERG